MGQLSVEITLDNSSGKFPIKLDKVVFKKSIDLENKVHHYIASNQVPAGDYYNYLEYAGLGRLNNLSLLSHKRLEDIVSMTGEEIYETLKDLTGAKTYEEKKVESNLILEKTETEKKKSEQFLKEIQEKLALLRVNLAEYERFEENTDKINTIQGMINQRKLNELHEKLEVVGVSEVNERDALNNLELKQEGILKETQKEFEEIKSGERYIEEFQKVNESAFMSEAVESGYNQDNLKTHNEKVKFEKKMNAEFKELQTKIFELEKEKTEVKKELTKLEMESQLQKTVSDISNQNFKGKGSKTPIEFKKNELLNNTKLIEDKIKKLSKKIIEVKEDETQLQGQANELEITRELQQNNLKQLLTNFEQMKKIAKPVSEESRTCDFQLSSAQDKFIGLFNNLLRQVNTCKQRKTGIDILHLLNVVRLFSTRHPHKFVSLLIDLISVRDTLKIPLEALYLHKLFAVVVEDEDSVEEIIRFNKELKGGRISIKSLSSFSVDINSSLLNAYLLPNKHDTDYEDILKRKRVFMLKEEVHLKTVDFAENKFGFLDVVFANRVYAPKLSSFLDGLIQTCGGPSDSLKQFIDLGLKNSKSKMSTLDVSLIERTDLKDISEILGANVFGPFQSKVEQLVLHLVRKGALVINLQDGQKFANEMNINCSTKEGEIVYSGGYLAKVGYQNTSKNFLFIYDQINVIFQNLKVTADELIKILRVKVITDKKRQDVEGQRGNFELERERIESEINMMENDISFLNEQLFKRKVMMGSLEAELEKREMEVKLTKKTIESLQSIKEGTTDAKSLLKKEKQNNFGEQLKQISQKLMQLDLEISQQKNCYTQKIKDKENMFMEFLQSRKESTRASRPREAVRISVDNPQIKEATIMIETSRAKYSELLKRLQKMQEELEIRKQHHAQFSAQKENYQKRILEITLDIV